MENPYRPQKVVVLKTFCYKNIINLDAHSSFGTGRL